MDETTAVKSKAGYFGKDIIPLSQISSEESEYDAKEFEELEDLYSQTLSKISSGEIVTGRITSISEKEIKIDIGFKSEGIIPTSEFTPERLEEAEVGAEIEVFIDSLEDRDGQLILSHKKADFMRAWERIIQLYEDGEVVQGTITRRVKGGMVVNILGVDCFLPGSQIDTKPIRDFDAYLDRELTFKIVKLNHLRKNVVVSSRILLEESNKDLREKILRDLEKGQILEGGVKNITDFGAFIDLGGVDGLLHITDMSWGRVNHPTEFVQLDERVKVMVIDFNEAKDRISLGLKQMQEEPWTLAPEKYPVGTVVKGKVVSITDYGAFIEIEKGVEGLIHISEMSWNQSVKHPTQLFAMADEVDAQVVSIIPNERKISLSVKKLQKDPWEEVQQSYAIRSKHTGTVRNITNFGVFVELEPGVDGLVHISDLSWTRKIRNPSEVVKKGDEIEVVIMDIDKDNRRISMSHKHIHDNPWEGFGEVYNREASAKGKVVRLIEKGLIVELPLGVEGFLPTNQLPEGKKKEDYPEGLELDLVVTEFDKENKKIVVATEEYFKARKEEKETVKAKVVDTEETTQVNATEEASPTVAETSDPAPTEVENVSDETVADDAPETGKTAVEGADSESGNEEEAPEPSKP